jgi:hypothetical protein
VYPYPVISSSFVFVCVCVFLGMNECSSFLLTMYGIGVSKSPVNYAMIVAKTREY